MESETLTETERNMLAGGVTVDEPAFEDYFGFDESARWYFPDGVQYIEYKLMTEGARSRYQSKTSRDIRLFKTTGDASVKMNPAEERKILFEESVTGWNVFRKGPRGSIESVPFGANATSGSEFGKWMDKANPKYISELEREIRKANVWMNAELTVEAIDEEIENLKQLREEAVKREEGKAAS